MSEDLLRETRALFRLLQVSAGRALSLSLLSRVLGESVGCYVYILDDGGRILARPSTGNLPCPAMKEMVRRGAGFPLSYAAFLAAVGETRANLRQEGWRCAFDLGESCPRNDILVTVVPVPWMEGRLGTLILTRPGRDFTLADIVQAEIAATVAGGEIVRRRTGRQENAQRRRVSVQAAMDALSNAEFEAVRRLMPVLLAGPGVLVTSREARRLGCTRSVVVNALHKLKSAGVIEARSQGMKGTYVKLVNDVLEEEVARGERRRRQGKVERRASPGGRYRPSALEAEVLAAESR